MSKPLTQKALATCLACGLTTPLMAQSVEELQAQLNVMQAQMAKMAQTQADQASNEWLAARRDAEVNALMQDVTSDLDARRLGAASGMVAGHNGKNFVLTNEDGSYSLKIAGTIAYQYLLNDTDDASTESGFDSGEIKLTFAGKAGDFGYKVAIEHNGSGGGSKTKIDAYEINYKLADGLKLKGGLFTLPFARQEIVSSTKQLAVGRGVVTEQFTVTKSEGIGLDYVGDSVSVKLAYNDGGDTNNVTSYDDDVEYAATGRVDVKLAGNWKQAGDEIAWNGEDTAAFVGAAVHTQKTQAADDTTLAATVDALVEFDNIGLSAAYFYGDSDGDDSADVTQHAYYVQGVYNIDNTWAPFVRYEWMDVDQAGADDLQAFTAGVNYYFKKHNAKLTADMVYIFDGDLPSAMGSGLANSTPAGVDSTGGEDEMVYRLQMQLKF